MGREEGLAAADRGDAQLRARGERGLLFDGDVDGRGRERRGRLGAVGRSDADAERVLAGPDARAHYFIADDGRAERFSYSFAVSHNQSGADGDARAKSPSVPCTFTIAVVESTPDNGAALEAAVARTVAAAYFAAVARADAGALLRAHGAPERPSDPGAFAAPDA